jgi:para-aminobenzoate synthetase component 1
VLEVWGGSDPLAELEGYLDDAGFFARGDDAVADVYLGYRLSGALRRAPWPDPPEPCRLPLLAARTRAATEPAPGPRAYAIGEWRRSWDAEGYAAAIEDVQAAIGRGDVYQANLVQHLRAPCRGDPAGLAQGLAPLRPLHPEPLAGEGWAIVSGSPELFLARRGDRVWTKPIKGTRPAGVHGELRESEKDAAEHVMIVDLERNDLSRVCIPGSVRWPDLMAERELAGVTHMVTTVEGRLRDGVGLAELLGAVFPGGSVTGAPKISARSR